MKLSTDPGCQDIYEKLKYQEEGKEQQKLSSEW